MKYIGTSDLTIRFPLKTEFTVKTNDVINVLESERDTLFNMHGTSSFEDIQISDLKEATLELTSAQIKLLFSAPQTLIAAPGAGKANIVDRIVASIDFGTAAYATNTTMEYAYETSGNKVSADMAALLTAVADKVVTVGGLEAELDASINEAVEVSVATGEADTGDGTVTVKAYYRVMSV